MEVYSHLNGDINALQNYPIMGTNISILEFSYNTVTQLDNEIKDSVVYEFSIYFNYTAA